MKARYKRVSSFDAVPGGKTGGSRVLWLWRVQVRRGWVRRWRYRSSSSDLVGTCRDPAVL